MEKPSYFVIYRDPRGAERVFHLTGTLQVGRSASCQIVLHDEGVSRHHCELRPTRTGCALIDLGSTNGTYLNGTKISEAAVRPGDRIVIGQACLVLEAAASPDEAAGPRTGVLGDTTVEVILKAASEKVPDAALLRDAGITGDAYSILFSVTRLINSGTDVDGILREFLELVIDLHGMDLGGVFLRDLTEETLEPVCEINKSGVDGYVPSRSVLNRVLAQNVSVVATDPLSDPRFRKASSIATSGAARILCVPMRAAGRVTGAVYLSSLKTSVTGAPPGENALQVLVAITSQVAQAIDNLRYRKRLERDNTILRDGMTGGAELVGRSRAVEELRALVMKVAATDATVLVTGESGTGKELVATAIHANSNRRERPMVSINCGAIPETMVETELFGHEKGAFTGAIERKAGKFELAHEGTLFLDEIGELPLALQVKLLRVLEERRFYRVGGQEEVRVDVRIIAATNSDLAERIKEGAFRQDLLFRLEVFRINAPPLREHVEDIPELSACLLERLGGGTIAPDGFERLSSHDWPGNVRELRNVLERELILSGGVPLTFESFSFSSGGCAGGIVPGARVPLQVLARAHIVGVLKLVHWNKKLAAEILGISRPTLYDKIKQYAISEDETRS